jgi:hypothetical protein
MRYRLRTLLIVLAIGPPLLAAAWFAVGPISQVVVQTSWDQWQPLAYQAASMALLIAGATLIVSLCHWSGTA